MAGTTRDSEEVPTRGTAGGFLLQAIIIAVTLLAASGVVLTLVRIHQRSQESHRRKALQISEDGLMLALDSLSKAPSWRSGIARTGHEGGSYEVRLRELAGSPLKLEVTAEGENGGVRRSQQCVLVLAAEGGDSVWMQAGMEEQ